MSVHPNDVQGSDDRLRAQAEELAGLVSRHGLKIERSLELLLRHAYSVAAI